MNSSVLASTRTSGSTFIDVAGHPIRWELLRELARSDRKVRELAALLRKQQGLVSYHLKRLRAARLVSTRRSEADGRDAYYSIDLERCGELIAATAEALHPALKLQPAPGSALEAAASPVRILFLCTGNSARSQMAEALLGSLANGAAVAVSAGSHPKKISPHAADAMRQRGIDISGWRAKSLDEFRDSPFDVVVTLCDRVREVCPGFPGTHRLVHWSIPDPSVADVAEDQVQSLFDGIAAELAMRIRFLLCDLPPTPNTPEEDSHAG